MRIVYQGNDHKDLPDVGTQFLVQAFSQAEGYQKAVADSEEVIDREAMKYLGVFLYLDK